MFSLAAASSLKQVGTHFERGPVQVYASVGDAVTGIGCVVIGGLVVTSSPIVGGVCLMIGGFQLAGGTIEWLKLNCLSCKHGLNDKEITIVHQPNRKWIKEIRLGCSSQ